MSRLLRSKRRAQGDSNPTLEPPLRKQGQGEQPVKCNEVPVSGLNLFDVVKFSSLVPLCMPYSDTRIFISVNLPNFKKGHKVEKRRVILCFKNSGVTPNIIHKNNGRNIIQHKGQY